MLAYRAWCETRARFAIAVVAIAAACALAAAQSQAPHALTFAAYVWSGAYNDSVRTAFALLAIVLGTGSLRQEQVLGTAGFTLALPVSRGRLLVTRAAVAVAEVTALAVFTGLAIAALSAAGGGGLELAAMARHVALWSGAGAVLATLALLVSVLVANEYVGWMVTVLALMAHQAVVQLSALRRQPLWDLFRIMTGDGVALGGALAAVAAASAVLLAVAHLRLRRRDF